MGRSLPVPSKALLEIFLELREILKTIRERF
jgi:hypothetical protein